MIHRKAMSLMSTAEAIAATAAAALSQATSQQTSPTGSTVTHNADGTKTISGSVLGTDSTGTSVTTATHVGDTTPPGIPTGITAWSGDGAVHVSWDGTLTGGIPADFCQVNLLVDGVAFAALNSAGSSTYNGASIGTTVQVTATSEDDACAIDGTAAHNVSAACTAISVTVTDAATITITSSNGLIFKNSVIATVLTAHVYKGGVEVTGDALAALGTIKWYKDGSSTAAATGQTLTIDAGDVTGKATYVAQLEG